MKTKTKKQIDSIRKYLEDRYGEVNPEWEMTLSLLADNLDLYEDCKKAVDLHGIYDSITQKKNPLLATMKDLQATILKQQQKLGITPYDAAKIKDQVEEDDEEDFIESLTDGKV